MQTALSSSLLATKKGQDADKILRSCVHCGFCTATCPTYLITGNELDSPRGRIYLIKEMLEGNETTVITQRHLDRCLSCQSCETTCPSNVDYHSLLAIGREHVGALVPLSFFETYKRIALSGFLTNPLLFRSALEIGRFFRFLLPAKLRKSISLPQQEGMWPKIETDRKMLILNGCVQKGLSPNTNSAAARVLAKFDIKLISLDKEGCCGALDFHMNLVDDAKKRARRNIDLICNQLDLGVEAVISSASGCGNFIKEYAELLVNDEEYAVKAKRVVDNCFDLGEVLAREDLSLLKINNSKKMAFHCPCSLQHGQKLAGIVEDVLTQLGFDLSVVKDSHICCGSAGTYSLFQANLSQQLQLRKIKTLEDGSPEYIATANIGCQSHLNSVSNKTIQHWIEFVDSALEVK